MRTLAIHGRSGSGKTTLIVELIRELVTRGVRVAAIKHTHHALNDDATRGDTAKFLAAGAMPVVLAGDGEAVVHRDGRASRIRFGSPLELLLQLEGAEAALIEGFRQFDGWPHVTIDQIEVR